MRRAVALCLAASLVATSALGTPGLAQAVPALTQAAQAQAPHVQPVQAQPTPGEPRGPYGMSMPEWQGVSCLWGGTLAGIGVSYFSDMLSVAATGMTNPLLLIPFIATGFVAGCSVASNAAPGLAWLYRSL